ncbi:MAG: glycerol acyltransferase [Chloroflexi bacterium]|nr:glycerol acyltransferase [Chloroflexota bacterium]
MGSINSAKQTIRGDNAFVSWFGRTFLRVLGWRLEGSLPDVPKFVFIAAPHTSNWDFLIFITVTFAFRTRCVWMGKDSIFRPPFGIIFSSLGGIPVDRNSSQSVVEQAIQVFGSREKVVMGISPEGTRRKTDCWRKGFYYIALGANVPLVFAFADYERKVTGFGPAFMPTGDIQADMKVFRDFYKDIKGKFPENYSDIRIKV